MTALAPQADLPTRLARLEARAAIADLMQDYADAADRKYTVLRAKLPPDQVAEAAHDQAACFTEDGIWSGGRFGGDLVGRAAIAQFFTTSPWLFTSHHYGSMGLTFDGTLPADSIGAVARVRWRLLELGVPEPGGRVVLLAGAVKQECRLTQAGWKIAQMRFSRLHAVEIAGDAAALRCLIPAGEPL